MAKKNNAIDWYRLEPRFENLGITNTAGTTLTINSADGTSLSASNQAFVTLQTLANPGIVKLFTVIANQSFTQAQLGNNLFGLTTARSTLDATGAATALPIYLYAVSNANNGENTIAFMISRVPHRTISPLAANIGQNGNTLASTQGSFFSLSAITAADYASSPCLLIGSFRMIYNGGTTNWTIQTLNSGDGIGRYNDQSDFAVSVGQFGANASNYFVGAGAPGITTVTGYVYRVDRNGFVSTKFAEPASPNAGGAGNAQMSLPFAGKNGGGYMNGTFSAGGGTSFISTDMSPNSSLTSNFLYVNPGGAGTIANSSFSNPWSLTLSGFFWIAIT